MNHLLHREPRPLTARHATLALTILLAGCGGGSSPTESTATGSDAGRSQARSVAAESAAAKPGAVTKADAGQPGVPVKPVTATSSALENGGMPATNTIDGDTNTRWGSAFDDKAWITWDFGAATQIGGMSILWQGAYGKEYEIQVSNDGNTFTTLRHVTNGAGGTEEFFNLGINARYVRMQGDQRATQYGYSILEATFKTPGSDNTLPVLVTSPVKFPKNGTGMVPLPTTSDPLETLQFTLADGTLVTRFGIRGLARHGRERGEDWNEIGYGPNDTVDAAGNPVDKGPGNFLTFVPNYFKNRTWGFEIVDNSRVAGVAQPTLKVNQYFVEDQLPGGTAWFRAFDRPGVTGYGWMNPGQLQDPNVTICHPVPYPPNGRLANANIYNNGCSLTVSGYPGHAELGTDGFPDGKDVPGRNLVVGDVIEVSPSFFSTTAGMAAVGDNGGLRYYAGEWTYVVGSGLKPSYGVLPRLMNAPLPVETLQGGSGSLSYDYADNGTWVFQQPFINVGMQNMQRFVEGRRLFHTDMYTGQHNEPGNDQYLPAVGLQGAHFNQSSCFGCHVNNGRSPAPATLDQRLDQMSIRTAAVDTEGKQRPDKRYGSAIQMNARSMLTGAPQDWGNSAHVAGFDVQSQKLADGTPVELRKPKISFDGTTPAFWSLRAAQPVLGVGLLEAVTETDILSRARNAPDEDGVKGRANYVFDPESGVTRLGRFGWKASKVSLRHQAATALLQDMSVTSTVYPTRDCLAGPTRCTLANAQPGLSEDDLQKISRYLELLTVPAQRSLASGFPKGVSPLVDLTVDPAKVANGGKIFANARCTACHVSELKTGPSNPLAELRSQTIKPYTDLLLHDMGTGLADGYTEGQANGNLWRTQPLWGIGYTDRIMGANGTVGYLHDGRARTLTEAIMWHGGEAAKAQQRFAALSASDRDALLAFLKSL